MFSFRKIINILVLISYVKMTIVSSFAMDSAYFGLNHKIRIEMTKTKAGGPHTGRRGDRDGAPHRSLAAYLLRISK